MSATKVTTSNERKLQTRATLKLQILADKVEESRIRCRIGEKLIAVRETFYPTDAAKRPTSKQVETFKRWCLVNVQIKSSTVDQYISAFSVIARNEAILEKVTTTRGLQTLARLNDEELAAAVVKLPSNATADQIDKVIGQVSETEKKKQAAAKKQGETSAATKKREAAKRDEDAASKKLQKVLPSLMVELAAAIDEDPVQGLCDAVEAVALMVSQCGILSFKVLPELLAPYRTGDEDTDETDETES